MEFGRRLRDLRKQKNLSQRDLAALVKVDFTYLSKIEGGRLGSPSEDLIRRLAQALDADEDELINLAGKVPKHLQTVVGDSPQAIELLRVLSERKLPDETYRHMLDLARRADAIQSDEYEKKQGD